MKMFEMPEIECVKLISENITAMGAGELSGAGEEEAD